MLANLKILRDEASVSQKQLAEAIGVSQQSINKYENHNIEPDIETMMRCIKAIIATIVVCFVFASCSTVGSRQAEYFGLRRKS